MAIQIRADTKPGLYVSPTRLDRAVELQSEGRPLAVFVDKTLAPDEWYVVTPAPDHAEDAKIAVQKPANDAGIEAPKLEVPEAAKAKDYDKAWQAAANCLVRAGS